MLGFAEGKLEKMKIVSYDKGNYSESSKAGEYEVLLNPETYSETYKILYIESKEGGTTGGELKFDKILPDQLKHSFLFDGTGVLGEAKTVTEQLDDFRKVVFDYSGDVHQPRYLKLIWGDSGKKELFKGRLLDLTITYTLFKPDGSPLRAKGEATFKTSIDKELEELKKKNNSPDLTHVRTVRAGDTLPLMAYRIYGDPSYYLEIARVNKLRNLGKLEAGTQIYFPPIDKKSV